MEILFVCDCRTRTVEFIYIYLLLVLSTGLICIERKLESDN